MNVDAKILPGATIGMIGGGQLGRMFAMAAAQMGYRVRVFCGSTEDPAAQVAAETVVAPLDDLEAAATFARGCDVVTLEFENIPAQTLAACNDITATHPSAECLATVQDRFLEKSFFANAGLPVTPFAAIADSDQAREFGERHGYPFILKTRRDGYDGKGQHRIEQPSQIDSIEFPPVGLGSGKNHASVEGELSSVHPAREGHWIAERLIDFVGEASVIVSRNLRGQTASFPVLANRHRDHILELTTLPADYGEASCEEAEAIAIAATKALSLVGLLCVELFRTGEGWLINEVAPRPHNSGHVTIEACHVDQFEQHVRAVCNLPPGQTRMQVPAAAMVNLLGQAIPATPASAAWDAFWQHPAARMHCYGKQSAKRNRKMGHVTVTGESREEVERIAIDIRDRLERGCG